MIEAIVGITDTRVVPTIVLCCVFFVVESGGVHIWIVPKKQIYLQIILTTNFRMPMTKN